MSGAEPKAPIPQRPSRQGLVIGVVCFGAGLWVMITGDVSLGAWLTVIGVLLMALWSFVEMNTRWVRDGRARPATAAAIRRVGLALMLGGVVSIGTAALFESVGNRTMAVVLGASLLLIGARFQVTARRILNLDEQSS